jgi:hypothetical protein
MNGFARGQTNRQRSVGVLLGILRGQLKAQVMGRELVQIVQRVLGQAKQVLGLLLLKRARVYRDAQREYWSAGLHHNSASAIFR